MSEKKLDKILNKLSGHDEKLDNLVTKEEFSDFKQGVLDFQDEVLTTIKKLDQERIFTTRWIDRIEKDLNSVKEKLNIN